MHSSTHVLLLAAILGQAGPPPAPTPAEVVTAIQQLGDDSFHVRETATKLLWQAGAAAEPALREALNHPDPEVVYRAKFVLKLFQCGVYPGTPPKIVALVEQYIDGDEQAKTEVIEQLCKLGIAGYSVLTRLTDGEADTGMRSSIERAIARHLRDVCGILLREGRVEELERLLELGLETVPEFGPEDYALWHILRGQAAAKTRELETKRSSNIPDALMLFHLSAGDHRKAREAGKRASEWNRELVLFHTAQWNELAGVPFGDQGIEELGFRAAFHRLAGNQAEFDRAILELRESGRQNPDEAWIAIKALLINEQPQEAVAMLVEGEDYYPAFQLLRTRLEYRQAFELLDQAAGADAIALAAEAAPLLAALGERGQARELLDLQIAEAQAAGDTFLYRSLISAENQSGFRDEAFRRCEWLLSRRSEVPYGDWPVGKAFPDQPDTAYALWGILRKSNPDQEPAAILSRLRQFFEAEPDDTQSIQFLQEALLAVSDATGRTADCETWLKALAVYCERSSLTQLAQECHEQRVELSGSWGALLDLGDFLARGHRWGEAAEAYDLAWQKEPSNAVPVFLRWWAQEQIGHNPAGRELLEHALLMPLGDYNRRRDLAQALESRGLLEEAERQYQFVPWLATWQPGGANEALRCRANLAIARKDYFLAADALQQLLLYLLGQGGLAEAGRYLLAPAQIHRWRAQGHLAQGNVEQGLREAELALRMSPGDVNVPVKLVPQLDKLQRKAEADALFEQVYQRHAQVCLDYPRAAGHHNDAAWLAARCRRRLDEALDHACTAVELSNNSPGYLGTLAEVHFQRGETEQAVALARQCLAAEPENNYFGAQLERFQAGDPLVDVPEVDPDSRSTK